MALLSFFLYQYLEKIGDRTVLQDALRRALLSTPLVPYSAAWSAHDLYERARLSVYFVLPQFVKARALN